MTLLGRTLRQLAPAVGALASAPLVLALFGCAVAQSGEPPYVDPGPTGGPPSDATVFLGRRATTLNAWEPSTTAGWTLKDGVLRAPAKGKGLASQQPIGDVQIHMEFRTTADDASTVPTVLLQGKYAVPGTTEGALLEPGPADSAPPGDAVILFDGSSLRQWIHPDGRPARWDIVDGILQCRPGTGNIISRYRFKSVQLHVEFATPYMPNARGQGRGNSGVYVQGRYEIQVLDSYKNRTYFNGQCGALYGQYAPLVNVCRPPKQWQTYDILFTAPVCDDAGNVRKFARLTVLHNGVVIHDNVEVKGPTGGALDHFVCRAGPLLLQDHGNLVQFRNIWLRNLDGNSVALAPRKAGRWQSYDIIFRAPRVDSDGTVLERGRVTLLHNGVLVRDRVPVGPQKGERAEVTSGTLVLATGPFEYRNIWVRGIEPSKR